MPASFPVMNRSDHHFFTVTEDGIILNIHVQPRASKNQVCGLQGQEIKLRLTSPPVEGAANKLCREFLADLFGVAKSYVTIVSGETSRHKRVKIYGDPLQFKKVIETHIISR
jgi:uncharacterized protein (TIGR00251 family)